MNHPPKQLALLISLIGGGLSPYAQARIHEHRADLSQTLPDIACTELDAAALPVCAARADRDLVWQPQRSAIDLSATAGVLVLYGARSDDWAPGESAGEFASDLAIDPASTVAAATREVIDTPRPQAVRDRAEIAQRGYITNSTNSTTSTTSANSANRETHANPVHRIDRVRVLARATATRIARFARADARAIERIAPIALAERAASSTPAERTGSFGAAKRARLPFGPPPPAASAGSVEVERLLANLANVLSGSCDPVPPAARSHSARVLAALGEFAAPAAPCAVEDGPARRLRKLEARAAKTREQAQAQIAAGGVDLLLPLEPPELPKPPAVASRVQPTGPFGDTTVALSETSLDRVRGGYAGEGLNISFGIERAVYINGSLATTTSLNVTDLGQLTAGRGTAVLDTGTIALIQSGAGNSVAGAAISASSMGTIVQNTLDGQKIQNVTVVNATANSLGVFRTMNLQSSLRGAVIDSLRR